MLRLLVLILLLANGAYFAWSQGLLRSYGLAPAQQAEPQRLAQQIRPEALHILSPDEARRLDASSAAPAGKPPECLQAGLYDDKQAAALREALSAWPAGAWSLDSAVEPARWIVYMGKYPGLEAVNKKKAELRQLNVLFEAPANPALEPGLSLGGFETQERAAQELEALTRRGVRTARVMQERAEARGQRLRLPVVDDSLRPRLDELKAALAAKPWRPCK
ncbi:SPOR domain-containing protein [Variovorax terrae]|uniref:SPOR domain-containing protein n=1 Tax=Variovorax terrae TaxID=2923278 RepID=A0A9X2AQA2_9BURK|nr:SPOR domain-containing protein [Variovorax terrae]MCJ0765785.1 SPOR domain-containing protein [Variovorax terrae]